MRVEWRKGETLQHAERIMGNAKALSLNQEASSARGFPGVTDEVIEGINLWTGGLWKRRGAMLRRWLELAIRRLRERQGKILRAKRWCGLKARNTVLWWILEVTRLSCAGYDGAQWDLNGNSYRPQKSCLVSCNLQPVIGAVALCLCQLWKTLKKY